MGKKRSRSGGRNQAHLLRCRVEEACRKHGCKTLSETVGYLRSAYTEYSRLKQQALAYHVRPAFDELHQIPQKQDWVQESESRKKKRRIEKGKENDSFRLSESESESDSHGDNASSSPSSAAINEEQVARKYDLLKSMLRANYKVEKPRAEEKNLEVEDVKNEKVLAINGDGMSPKRCSGALTGSKVSKSSEVNGKEHGPRFSDFGGMESVLEGLKKEVIVPLCHPHVPIWVGTRPISGILLHGPPGCGKTKLAHAIANETGLPFYKISSTELVSGVSGASEENIRELFLKAEKTTPSIVFIDEIDAIASKRENLQREMERRIVTQLMTCMDESNRRLVVESKKTDSKDGISRSGYVLVIGSTNRPDAMDPALRRPGRFDREIMLGVPDENARVEILKLLASDVRLAPGDIDFVKLARATPGFVGADLDALVNEAGNIAIGRVVDERKLELSNEATDMEASEDWWKRTFSPEEMERFPITMADLEEAAKMVQPSLKREGFSMIPNVNWADVGGLQTLRRDFERFIVWPIKHPKDFEKFGVDMETGFLLYGPPGCGKTLIAKALANEAGANFIYIKGPELLSKYVGESELAVRTIFNRARTCSPCILFFDEIDSLTMKCGNEVVQVPNQLLAELDGADERKGVFVIGATNRPEVMDKAFVRPGRFGQHFYVPLPSPDERGNILQALARKKPVDASVDLLAIAKSPSCENFSGADLSALMKQAFIVALEEMHPSMSGGESCTTPLTIKSKHFEQVLCNLRPSVDAKQKEWYDGLCLGPSSSNKVSKNVSGEEATHNQYQSIARILAAIWELIPNSTSGLGKPKLC